ncbi:glycosyl hydrolase [Candidatus Poribacteria bacterium]|nr:glycosyl hydrolase [Candidatus Poribacteria bacterium]
MASSASNGALAPRKTSGSVTLLVGTIKGAFFFRSDKTRSKWSVSGPVMLGQEIYHILADPRDPAKMVMATKTGHLGPTMHRSGDGGKTWTEARKPPAFAKAREGEKERSVRANFWLAPGHHAETDTWYLGTVPLGLFRSEDGGETWKGVNGLNNHPDLGKWCGGDPPGGPYLHSICVDPRDAKHLYIGLSAGGIFESKDAGKKWKPLNAGCFVDFGPDNYPEYGQDPHCMVMHPMNPDILYQQNHCGIYRMNRADAKWERIGNNMPKEVGDIGFPIAVHPRDTETAWVFPMDGTQVWPRTSPSGKPAAYVTRDGGKSWSRQANGLPKEHAYYTVFRQAMTTDAHKSVGVYFGTTSGELWASTDEGGSWSCIACHLPRILAVETMAS